MTFSSSLWRRAGPASEFSMRRRAVMCISHSLEAWQRPWLDKISLRAARRTSSGVRFDGYVGWSEVIKSDIGKHEPLHLRRGWVIDE
jgi:hypothetical protein